MSRDRSLDEFFDSESEGESDSGAAGDDADPEPEAESRDVEDDRDDPGPTDARGPAVDPLATTYAWSSDGECTVCGSAANARWRDDGEFVCADCKDW